MEMCKQGLGYCCIYPFASPNYDESIALRQDVLRKPLGLEFSIEQLESEWNQIHLGYFNPQDQLLACLVLQRIDADNLKMRQVAVYPQHQGQGLGRLLVEYSEGLARSGGYKLLSLHAREGAVPFYLALNYKITSKIFEEVGIGHFRMEKSVFL
ncbi:MAG: GNAT family N-acetyltransferase [Saprospiraceae bacterium]|nr:GNAT family N-acetyltransferase [Saprospiraceae bacterium]